MNLPVDVANEALDEIGAGMSIGDIEDGGPASVIVLRHYGQCLRQILRGAQWDFARKKAPLILLADSTGQTQAADTAGNAAVDRAVPGEWRYAYAYPDDCMKVREIPFQPAPSLGATIPSTAVTPFYENHGRRAAPFEIGADVNHPPSPGLLSWEIQGVSPQARTVIMTNVPQAQCIYTMLTLYPSQWDPLFRAALVAHLASKIALAVHAKNLKAGMEIRAQQIMLAKQALIQARVANGNEGMFSADIRVDWMETRRAGYAWDRAGWGDPRNAQAGYSAYNHALWNQQFADFSAADFDPVDFADGTRV